MNNLKSLLMHLEASWNQEELFDIVGKALNLSEGAVLEMTSDYEVQLSSQGEQFKFDILENVVKERVEEPIDDWETLLLAAEDRVANGL